MNESTHGHLWDVATGPDGHGSEDVVFIDGDTPINLTVSDLIAMTEELTRGTGS